MGKLFVGGHRLLETVELLGYDKANNDTNHAVVRANHHPAFLFLIILNVWTTFSNLVVLYVFFKNPHLRRRFGCVMFSLSIADLLSSIFVMPTAIYYFVILIQLIQSFFLLI